MRGRWMTQISMIIFRRAFVIWGLVVSFFVGRRSEGRQTCNSPQVPNKRDVGRHIIYPCVFVMAADPRLFGLVSQTRPPQPLACLPHPLALHRINNKTNMQAYRREAKRGGEAGPSISTSGRPLSVPWWLWRCGYLWGWMVRWAALPVGRFERIPTNRQGREEGKGDWG